MNTKNLDTKTLSFLIVDDHPILLHGTSTLIQGNYPNADIITATTVSETLSQLKTFQPDAVIVDLSLPETAESCAELNTGLDLLRTIMETYPKLNIMVLSSSPNALIRLKIHIDNHQGGFTIAQKMLPPAEILKILGWCVEGVTYTKVLKTDLEVKPEWVEVLDLAFKEGLQDKAIAQRMYKSLRMIRHYWTKIQDALAVYPETNQNLKALTLIRAKEEGLID